MSLSNWESKVPKNSVRCAGGSGLSSAFSEIGKISVEIEIQVRRLMRKGERLMMSRTVRASDWSVVPKVWS